MKHFNSEEWADFVRLTLPGERRNAMERHLVEGCQKCKKTVGIWRTLLDWATSEHSYEPPDSVLRTVKGLFALHKPSKPLPRALALARLVFDSFREPLPAGVRAGMRPPRQALYKAGRYWVDMRLEKMPGSDRCSIVGQVLDASSPSKGMTNLPIFLLSGSRELARTATNRFGEFHLDVDVARHPRLCVGITESKAVVVPLPAAKQVKSRGLKN